MLASPSAPFDDSRFLFEVKWDGVRAMTAIADGKRRVWGREGVNYTERYPELAVLDQLPDGTMLDGELVVVRDRRPDFLALMQRHARRPRPGLPFFAEPIRYVVFDLLFWGGESLLNKPLTERRAVLLDNLPVSPYLSVPESVIGKGRDFFTAAVAAGHEGVVAKQLASTYKPNQRGTAWQKVKPRMELPCVVIGYRMRGRELRDLVMATLLDGKLSFAGVVELGIDGSPAGIRRLESLRITKPVVACSLTARWVKPEVFGVVRFAGWRPGGVWRDAIVAANRRHDLKSTNRRS